MLADVSGTGDVIADNGGTKESCLLAPIADPEVRTEAAALGAVLAAKRNVGLCLSEETSTESVSTLTDTGEKTVAVQHAPSVSGGLSSLASRCNATAVVMKRDRNLGVLDDILSSPASKLAASGTADVLTITGDMSLDSVASILVPITDGPNSPLAVETAVSVALAHDTAVDLFHVKTPESEADGEKFLEKTAARILDEYDDIELDTWLFEAEDVAEAIIEQSQYYDLTVIGAPQSGRLQQFVFGSTTKDVEKRAVSPVIVSHARR